MRFPPIGEEKVARSDPHRFKHGFTHVGLGTVLAIPKVWRLAQVTNYF